MIRLFLTLVTGVGAWFVATAALAEETKFTNEQIEFFEKNVRPVLIERCFACHSSDAEEVKAGLLLESRQAMLKGGESGSAISPGDAEKSLLVQSIRYQSVEMPPKGKLPKKEIAAIAKWVDMGAPWPDDGKSAKVIATPAEESHDWETLRNQHWAFRPIQSPLPPQFDEDTLVENDIDRFVITRLKAAGLQPASRADRRTLVRRAYYDLVGLPPTIEEVEAFVADDRPDAFARLVDRLLDSPHYGERWGRHWLDVARYSDGFGGFLDNKGNANAWRYRDWVVQSLNNDLPINEFIKLQIAGDLIDKQNGAVATGFFALGPTYRSDGGDPDAKAQAESETLDDRIDTLSRGLLGLTVSCSRCHDHKFDPIPQLDYYSLAGVFRNTRVVDASIAPPAEIEAFNNAQQQIKEAEKNFRQRDAELKKDKRQPTQEEQQELQRMRDEINQLKKDAPPKPASAHALADSGSADMKLAIRGNLLRLGATAPRRFLRVLHGEDPAKFTQGSGRKELAEAIVEKTNPLTARVFVNRVWMHHFGSGLVRTPSNFGALGERPTHPLLLDYLATTFVKNGWSLKDLHRRIMNSATYQMGSDYHAKNHAADGDNKWLWRMNPRRLNVEAWRDTLHFAVGDLDLAVGGPPVNNIAIPRRTIYLQVSRNGDQTPPDGFMRLFDFPEMRATIAKRSAVAKPQQYLFMLNNEYMRRRAELFSQRVQKESPEDADRIQHAYQILFGRKPTQAEQEIGMAFLATKSEANQSASELWTQYARVLLSSNELMYVE